ncbi:preprotein translocase subunit YajC [Streptomyces sp. NPDC015346]|uniref:preprotein translocase subunit YajC n=1 Tax=Streptomyces sp. NPDC015346 TaxID=3364954 RepID=UPI0036F641D0
MSIVTLLPFIVLIGAMFLMTRSAKKKQQAAAQMRNEMQPGTGVRTIGGMYATVKEIGDETVLLEIAPGVHAVYAKNAIGAVLEDSEYNRIVHGDEPDAVVPDDASSLTESAEVVADTEAETVEVSEDAKPDLTKKVDAAEAETEVKKDGKADGGTEAK